MVFHSCNFHHSPICHFFHCFVLDVLNFVFPLVLHLIVFSRKAFFILLCVFGFCILLACCICVCLIVFFRDVGSGCFLRLCVACVLVFFLSFGKCSVVIVVIVSMFPAGFHMCVGVLVCALSFFVFRLVVFLS